MIPVADSRLLGENFSLLINGLSIIVPSRELASVYRDGVLKGSGYINRYE